LPTSSLDTTPLLQSNGTNTHVESCANERQTDGSQTCQCGKGMFDCSIHPSTRDEWILSQRDSLARILVSLENRPDLEKALAAGFTAKSCESLAWYDRDTSFWKTYQQSFLTGWEPYSETWPRWGMMQDGSAFAHQMSALRMGAIDGGYSREKLWLTPRANESGERNDTFIKRMGDRTERCASSLAAQVLNPITQPQNWPTPKARNPMDCPSERRRNQPSLETMVKMWPTPSAHNAKETGAPSQINNRNTVQLGDLVGGRLNPIWVCWLQNFPLCWFESSGIIGFNNKGKNNAEKISDSTDSSMQSLQQYNGEKEIPEQYGGYGALSKKEVLRSDLHGESDDSAGCDIGWVAVEGAKISQDKMRNLRDNGESANSSHRQQPSKQFSAQPDDVMRRMPHEMALGKRKECIETKTSEAMSVLRENSEAQRVMQYALYKIQEERRPEYSAENSQREVGCVPGWWEIEPNIGRVTNETKDRANMLKGLGNAQVPLQAAVAWRLLMGKE